MNRLFDDMMTSVLKALVSYVTSRNQTWKSTLGSDYLRVIDVIGIYFFYLYNGFLLLALILART